jgi:molecular chaperone GrpE
VSQEKDKGMPENPPAPQSGAEPALEAEPNSVWEIIRQELEAKINRLEEGLGAAKSASEEMKDRWMRAAADLENYKKRVSKERAEDRALVLQEGVSAFLPVADSLERALEAAKAHLTEAPESPVLSQLLQGVELTLRQMNGSLERLKVVPIPADRGQVFDPSVHQALLQEEHGEMDEGCILEVMQKGYSLDGRVLRPALVKVSRKP